MHRSIPGTVIAVIVVIAAGFAAALWASDAQQPAGQLVVQGRVTGIDGKPVSGIKVWLNAWPRSSGARTLNASSQPVPVTVVRWVITSAAGRYVIRVSSPAALPEVANGVIKFSVMTGNSAGWDTASFYCRLVSTTAGARLAVPPGGTTTVDLHLKR